jgi:hypothetical protein
MRVSAKSLFSSATPTEEYTAECTSVYCEEAAKIITKNTAVFAGVGRAKHVCLTTLLPAVGVTEHFRFIFYMRASLVRPSYVQHVYQQQDVAIFSITVTSWWLDTISA